MLRGTDTTQELPANHTTAQTLQLGNRRSRAQSKRTAAEESFPDHGTGVAYPRLKVPNAHQ
jgi:hypothetical protein